MDGGSEVESGTVEGSTVEDGSRVEGPLAGEETGALSSQISGQIWVMAPRLVQRVWRFRRRQGGLAHPIAA